MKRNKLKMSCKRGFTLIELLVVVLIIGILAAVAVPQYQKAVEKARATEAITLLKSVYQSLVMYHLEKGRCPTSFGQLDMQVPWTGNIGWNTAIGEVLDTRSGDKWSIQLINSGSLSICGLEIGRISGSYAGTGFGIYLFHPYSEIPKQQVLCLEKNKSGNFLWENKGAYCKKIFAGNLVYGSSGTYTYVYKLP